MDKAVVDMRGRCMLRPESTCNAAPEIYARALAQAKSKATHACSVTKKSSAGFCSSVNRLLLERTPSLCQALHERILPNKLKVSYSAYNSRSFTRLWRGAATCIKGKSGMFS